MRELTEHHRKHIIEFLAKKEDLFGLYDSQDQNPVDFLATLLALKEMPALTKNFDSAYQELYFNFVQQDHFTTSYVLIDYLGLATVQWEVFVDFLEKIVSKQVRKKKDQEKYVFELNELLLPSGYELTENFDYATGPKFVLESFGDARNNQRHQNLIPFEVQVIEGVRLFGLQHWAKDLKKPSRYPCFVLAADNWDDSGFETTFWVFYFDKSGTQESCGKLKIMKLGAQDTWREIPRKFTELTSDYCSLGQTEEYYERIGELMGNERMSYFDALQDCAVFPAISEDFELERGYRKSLLRSNIAERLTRQARQIVLGFKISSSFDFQFAYAIPGADSETLVDVVLSHKSNLPGRIFAAIGKNGVGKTEFLSNLALALAGNADVGSFSPYPPSFGKIIALSYSAFDSFAIPTARRDFNYVYSGLRTRTGSIMTEAGQRRRFYRSARLIKDRGLIS